MAISVSDRKLDRHRLTVVRAGFVAQGTSLHEWWRINGLDTSNVRKALAGQWVGPKASAIILAIDTASKVKA